MKNKVLIIGLRSTQLSRLKSLYPNLDFKIVSDKVSNHQSVLRDMKSLNAFDYIFTMTKFTSHKIDSKCKMYSSLIRVSGAFSNLLKVLDNIFNPSCSVTA